MDRHADCRTGVKPVVGGLRSRYTFFLRNHSDRRWFSRPWNVIPRGLEPHQKPIKFAVVSQTRASRRRLSLYGQNDAVIPIPTAALGGDRHPG